MNIKNRTYYFFDDMMDIADSDPNLLKIDKKSYESIGIYYIGYITVKDSDYVKIDSVNHSSQRVFEARDKYRNLSEEDKNKKRAY